MVLYSCKHCNYSSNLFSNYKRHLKTKKHQRNINPDYNIEEEMALKTPKDPKKTPKDPRKLKILVVFTVMNYLPLLHTNGVMNYINVKNYQ